MTSVSVTKIMTEDVLTLSIPGSRQNLLDAIKKYRKSAFPVVKSGTKKLVGMVGRADLLSKASETQLSLLMNENVPTVSSSDNVVKAANLLKQSGNHRVAVVDNEELIGIVSVADIVRKILISFKEPFEVKNLYREGITSVWEGTPLNTAGFILSLSGQQALPVLGEKGNLAGILAAFDLMKVAEIVDSESVTSLGAGAEHEPGSWDSASVFVIATKNLVFPGDRNVGEIMTKNVETVYIDSSLREVARRFKTRDIDQCPVVDAKENLLGMITDRDLLNAYVKASNR
ncbi:MAG: CBS domain-containing protein [Candidatus Hodarchaeales archaeon]